MLTLIRNDKTEDKNNIIKIHNLKYGFKLYDIINYKNKKIGNLLIRDNVSNCTYIDIFMNKFFYLYNYINESQILDEIIKKSIDIIDTKYICMMTTYKSYINSLLNNGFIYDKNFIYKDLYKYRKGA